MPIQVSDVIMISAGGIVGYLGRQLLEHKLAIMRNIEAVRVSERNKAAATLRAAFAPSLATIYLATHHGSTHEAPNVDAFLRNALPDLAAAIEVFRPFLLNGDKRAYQEAWEAFRYEVHNYGFDATTLKSDIDDPYKEFECKIHSILKYAEPLE